MFKQLWVPQKLLINLFCYPHKHSYRPRTRTLNFVVNTFSHVRKNRDHVLVTDFLPWIHQSLLLTLVRVEWMNATSIQRTPSQRYERHLKLSDHIALLYLFPNWPKRAFWWWITVCFCWPPTTVWVIEFPLSTQPYFAWRTSKHSIKDYVAVEFCF